MRIVHFSDVHVGCFPRGYSFLFDKRLLGALNFILRRRLRLQPYLLERAVATIRTLAPDCVVCTGDITCVGSPEEFEAAVGGLLPLSEGPWTFLYVPGNHDCYVRNRACRTAMAEAFAELNGGRWQLDELPQKLVLGDVTFYVVNESMPTNWLLSSGAFSEEAERRLVNWLEMPRDGHEKRVLVGHFPLRDERGECYSWRRRLVDSKPLLAAVGRGHCDALLCGHEHRPFVRTEDSGCMEICAGALTMYGKLSVLDSVPTSSGFSHFWIDLLSEEPTPPPLSMAEAPLPAAR